MENLNFFSIIIGILGGCSAILAGVLAVVKKFKELKQEIGVYKGALKKTKKIVGVIGEEPKPLANVPEFTDLDQALLSDSPIVILYCRTLSYALRHTTDVCYDGTGPYRDPKIHKSDDPFWETLTV